MEIDRRSILEESYSLGSTIEVYDSELWAIDKATRLAYSKITINSQIRDI